MSVDGNTAVVERLVNAFNERKFDLADTLYAPDYVSHNPAPFATTSTAGGPGTRAMRGLAEAVADARAEIVRLVPNGELVVAHTLVHGKHEKELAGIPGVGDDVVLEFINIFRIENGLIPESWGLMDAIELMQQLGVNGPARQSRAAPPSKGNLAVPP